MKFKFRKGGEEKCGDSARDFARGWKKGEQEENQERAGWVGEGNSGGGKDRMKPWLNTSALLKRKAGDNKPHYTKHNIIVHFLNP